MQEMKKALIIGSNGQDGSYLIELLLEKGYEVHGTIRRSSTFNTKRIDHLMNDNKIFGKNLFIHYADVTDPLNISDLIRNIKPDEIYNLSAQSHVKVSFEIPYYTGQVDALGVLNVLEAVRQHSPKSKVYQASTSELYGGMGYNMPEKGYNETSQMHPRSPYGCAKMYGLWITRNYREAYGIFSCTGILFNHESPRRGETFVSRKITLWFAEYVKNRFEGKKITPCSLGNLNAKRDWGFAKDYCEAMILMLNKEKPEDYVIATGETYSVRDFIEKCFSIIGKTVEWKGTGVDEVGICDGEVVIQVNPKYFRPSEVEVLLGDSTKARNELNWKPKYNFTNLVESMVISDLKDKGVDLQ
jgi:GDPmannose 4,6-dehydratase